MKARINCVAHFLAFCEAIKRKSEKQKPKQHIDNSDNGNKYLNECAFMSLLLIIKSAFLSLSYFSLKCAAISSVICLSIYLCSLSVSLIIILHMHFECKLFCNIYARVRDI